MMGTTVKCGLALAVLVIACAGCQKTWTSTDLTMTTYGTFNNSVDKGWRGLAADSKYLDAANLIGRYIDANQPILESWQIGILRFHQGQMFGCAGRIQQALQAITEAKTHDLTGGNQADYSAYIDATAAFLREDKAALISARDDIQAAPSTGANDILRTKSQVLVNKFGSSYRKAWEAAANVAVPVNDLVDELVPNGKSE